MIRYAVITIIVGGLMILAVRRWHLALCGLVLMTVLTQHPSMPSRMFGLQGLNPWNAVFLVILLFWWLNRRNEPLAPHARDGMLWLILAYVGLVLTCGLAAMYDAIAYATSSNIEWILVDGIVNPIKYAAVGLLMYDGARTRQRVQVTLITAALSGVAYAALMYKSIGLRILTIDYEDARRLTDKLVGLFANDLGELLAFTFWAVLFLMPALRKGRPRWACVCCSLLLLPAFAALKSRAGFFAFGLIGFIMGIIQWRSILVMLIAGGTAAVLFVPSVTDRILTGVTDESVNWDAVSAGRTSNIWPPVIEQITKSPLIGHGRFAILRTECREEIVAREGVVPTHPHNAYLEILLDAGLVGLWICMAILFVILVRSIKLLRMHDDGLMMATGAMSIAAVLALLSAGVSGSSFFARQSSVPYLCVWGVVLRAHAVCFQRHTLRSAAPLVPRMVMPRSWHELTPHRTV